MARHTDASRRPFFPHALPTHRPPTSAVLDELRDLWEAKLAASGALDDAPPPGAPPRRGAPAAPTPAAAPVVPDAARALLAGPGGGGGALGGPSTLALGARASPASFAAAAARGGLAAPPRALGAAVPPLPLAAVPPPSVAPLPLAPLPLDGGGAGPSAPKRPRTLPQADGPAGDGDAAAPPAAGDEAADTFDDVPSSDEDGGDVDDARDTLLALFDKVSRTRNRWKAVLRACVLHAGGVDTLVAAANGEFEF